MANNKKIFTIEINGLSESVKSVGALQEKIDALNKSLKGMGKTKIKIGEGSADAEYNKLLADRQKQLAAVNKELQQTGKNVKEYKQETKELVALEEKARNETKGYAHTLAGLKQELKDLKVASQNIDYGSDQYVKMSEEIFAITKQLKDLEEAQGTFGRNVGNYTSAIDYLEQMGKEAESVKKRAQELPAIWEKLKATIDSGGKISSKDVIGTVSFTELTNELSSLRKAMDDAIDEKDVAQLKKYYDQLKVVGDEYKRLRGEAVKADNQLKTQLQRTINGQTYTWENLTAAVGELEDKLYQLAADGRKNTQEFKNIAKAAAELKTELRQVDYEIDSMAESSKGVNKLVSMTQGFTAIAQGAVGIGQLFGMDSENAMKGIQTMTALQGIASALQVIQEQSKQGTAFGKMMKEWSVQLETFMFGLEAVRQKWIDFKDIFEGKILDIKELKIFDESQGNFRAATIDEINDYKNGLSDLIKKQSETVRSSRELRVQFLSLYDTITALGGEIKEGGIGGFLNAILDLHNDGKINAQQLDDLNKKLIELDDALRFKSQQSFKGTKAFFNDLLEGLGIISSTAPKAASGIKILANSLKLLGKATLILLGFQILIEIIGWISDLVGKIYTWASGNEKLVNSLNKVETEIDLVNKSIDRYITNLQRLRDQEKQWITDTEMSVLKMEAYEKALLNAAKALKEFSKLRGGESLSKSTEDDVFTFFGKGSDINEIKDAKKRVEEFRKVYEELQKAVEAGVSEKGTKDWWGIGNWFKWFDSGDAKADLGEAQKKVIKDLQYQINNLDLSKGTEEIKRFYELLQDPMYASSLENVENLFPEEEWAQVLKKRVEQIQSMYEQFDEAAAESAKTRLEEEKRLTKELVDYQKNVAKQVRDNNTEAIEDEYERELQALKNAKRDELDAAQGNLELIVSINKKYNRLEMDMLKKHQEDKLKELEESEWDITDILRRIRDNRLSAEEESLDKHLQEIENERKDALEDAAKEAEEAAKEGHNLTELYNELALSINIKYDALIKKEKEQYYQDLLDMYEDYERAMQEVQMQYRANNLDNKSSDVDINYNDKLNSSSGSFDFSAKYGKLIQEEKKFNQERLKIELDYLEDKKKLDEEYAKFEKDDATNQEIIRYEDALKNLKKTKEEGKLTIDEYNSMIEREEELHMQQMTMIDSKYNNDLTTINNQYLNERKSTISQSLSENADLYQEYSNQVSDIMQDVGKDVNAFGIMDYGKTKAQLEKAQQAVEEGVSAIDSEISSLERKLKNKEINYSDYKQARQQLERTKKELKEQGEDISIMLSDLFKQVAGQWKDLLDSWVSQVSSLLSTLNETQTILIDNQLAEIEHQLEIQQEAYDKAEEAAEAHKDKMDAIEDELADARGSRRQFLIDTLAAQQAAYLEDLAAQQKAEQEKEKLEEKQKSLEKKRAEQEKKAKVQQAVINTYMAVSNALAVQPWFVGLALSAVALALGMKNVSAIKATPIYEDGGVIQGARHSQGGVKVLGGQAEVEGGEFITNRKSTAANLPLLTYINDNKKPLTAEDLLTFFSNGTPTVKSKLTRKFASGGQLPTTDGTEVNRVMSISDTNEGNKTYIVQVTDIINAQKNLEKVQVLSGLVNE